MQVLFGGCHIYDIVASGIKNADTMLGCLTGVLVGHHMERERVDLSPAWFGGPRY